MSKREIALMEKYKSIIHEKDEEISLLEAKMYIMETRAQTVTVSLLY